MRCKGKSEVQSFKQGIFTPSQVPVSGQSFKIQEYFGNTLVLDQGYVTLSNGKKEEDHQFYFGVDKIKEMCACKNTALFINTAGQLFTSGLTNLIDGTSQGKLDLLKVDATLCPNFSDNVEFTRCWIQSNMPQSSDNTGYAIVEAVVDKATVMYFSYGRNVFGCLGNGLDVSKPCATFTPLVLEQVSFEYISLSPHMAVGVDIFTGALWVIGGKAPFKDDTYFPDCINQINNFPLRTMLMEFLKT